MANFRIHNSFFLADAAESSLPMTMRRPEEISLATWLLKDLSLKTIVVTVLAIAGTYYRQSTKVAVVSAETANTKQRQEDQLVAIRSKVDKATYEADQIKLSNQLLAIQGTQNTILTAVITRNNKGE